MRVCVRAAGRYRAERGMGEVLGGTPDHTSFNHVRVCNHFVHIFGCIGDRSCYCTNCTHREGLTGGETGKTV